MICIVEESSPSAPFSLPNHTSCLNDVLSGRKWLDNQFGVEAAEQDGSDAAANARPHLTNVITNLPVQIPTYSYVENIRTQATNSNRHVMS